MPVPAPSCNRSGRCPTPALKPASPDLPRLSPSPAPEPRGSRSRGGEPGRDALGSAPAKLQTKGLGVSSPDPPTPKY